MRLSDKAKQQFKPRGFWLSVAIAAIVISIVGVWAAPEKYASIAVVWFWAATLFVIWSVTLWRLFRFGRQTLHWHRVLILLGFTVLAVHHLWPNTPADIAWVGEVGVVLVMIGFFAPWFSSAPRPKGGSDAA